MKITTIVAAAGCGRRMHAKTDKPFIRLCKKEMILYCLGMLERLNLISEIIVVAQRKNIPRIKALVKKNCFVKIKHIVKGGSCRCESVLNGLKVLSEDSDIVVVHDCARPLVDADIINRTIRAAIKNNCAIAAVRVKPTIKKAYADKPFIAETLDRATLWEAHTPQAFRAGLLKDAYRKAGNAIRLFTDDAGIVEQAGHKINIVESSYKNIKITTREDIIIAEALLKKAKL
jgi:2-C-methyl-D-erythritol 4-phosphate cytidylyltransferase